MTHKQLRTYRLFERRLACPSSAVSQNKFVLKIKICPAGLGKGAAGCLVRILNGSTKLSRAYHGSLGSPDGGWTRRFLERSPRDGGERAHRGSWPDSGNEVEIGREICHRETVFLGCETGIAVLGGHVEPLNMGHEFPGLAAGFLLVLAA